MPVYEFGKYRVVIIDEIINASFYDNKYVDLYFKKSTITITVSGKDEAKKIFEENQIGWIYD